MGNPSPEAWNRVRRYASWMRRVWLDDELILGEDASSKFRLNSPAGGWFPALQDLNWSITKSNLPYADLFFSPHLKDISIFVSLSSSGISRDALPAITSTISALPTSTLQRLQFNPVIRCADLTDTLSSAVLRCGPSLTEFTSRVPLSDAAVNHLIRLPRLRLCTIEGPPPSYSPSHSPLVFPPLADFTLGEDTAREWVSLLEPLGGCVTPLSKVKESLKFLTFPAPTIDASFASLIQTFRNLVNLNVEVGCRDEGGEDRCIFKLNNDDVTELAMALPQLKDLILGYPCSNNTCATTAACLLPISVYCVEIGILTMHFNTTNIIDDLKNISGSPIPRATPAPKVYNLAFGCPPNAAHPRRAQF